jgi:O-antigen/teichoic acid export membrane protein
MREPDSDSSLKRARAQQGSNLTVNAAVHAGGSIAYYFAIVLVTPLAIAGLGDHVWGLWQIVGSITGYGLLIELGLTSAVSFHVSGAVARDDPETLAQSLTIARVYMLGAAIALLALTLLVGPGLLRSLVATEDLSIATRALYYSVGIAAVGMPIRIYLSVLSGLQQYQRMAIYRLLGGAFLILMVIGASLRQGIEFIPFVVMMSIAPLVAPVFAWGACKRILPHAAFRWRGFSSEHFRTMLSYAASTIVYSTGSVILFQTMKLIASWRAGGPEAAGHIGIVINVIQILAVLFIPIAGVVHPRASELMGRGEADKIPGVLLGSLKTTAWMAIPITAFLMAVPHAIFDAWVGSVVSGETLGSLARTMRWMAIGQGVYVLFLPCFYALLGIGEHRVFGIGMILAGIANAVLGSVLTVTDPRIETLGMAFTLSLSALVLGVTVPVTLRRFGLGIGEVFRKMLAGPLLATIPAVLATQWVPPTGDALLDLVLLGTAFSIVVLPIAGFALRKAS